MGHDEYWSGRQRRNVEAARDAGVHLGFFSGNEVFWEARLEPGERAVLLMGLLGHEWDEDLDNGFRPPGLFRLSETTIDNAPYVQDCGSVFGSGTATHHLTLYRHASGALVFGAGTVQWAWGLDAHHDTETGVPPERMNENTTRVGVDPYLGAYRARLFPARRLRGRDASPVDRAFRPAAGSARVQPVTCNELPGENVVPTRSDLGRRAAGNSLHPSNRDPCAMLDSAPTSLTRAVREAPRESSPSQAGPPWRC